MGIQDDRRCMESHPNGHGSICLDECDAIRWRKQLTRKTMRKPHNPVTPGRQWQALLLVIVVLLVGCVDKPKQAFGSTVWSAQCRQLPSQQYQACYGPGRLEDGNGAGFNKYRISVDQAHSAGSYISVFEKEYSLADIDPSLIDHDAHEVVSFDSSIRRVTFKLGPTQAEYKLP